VKRPSYATVVGKHVLGCFHDHFWCRDLFQHSVIHYGAHKTPFGYRSALIAIGSFSKRFASGLKAAGSFLTRSISIQDAMSRAPSNCRRDATNAVHNLWEIGENKQIRRGLQDLAKQVAQAAKAVSRVNLQVAVLQSSFPQDKKTRTRKRQRLVRSRFCSASCAAHPECVQTEKDGICAAHAALRPGHAALPRQARCHGLNKRGSNVNGTTRAMLIAATSARR
jgi:putative component of membrane protein insertase Oxa1/YidC/SpoIIIJ protein YidD